MPNEVQFPDPDDLPQRPDRIICHWSAGGLEASAHDLQHYHYLIEHIEVDPRDASDDRVNYVGGVPLERNMQDVGRMPSYASNPSVGYAAHTRNFNSGSIGLSLCGMRGAVDHRPGGEVEPGPSPITRLQVRAMFNLLRQLCAVYGLNPVEREVFTHYEAEHLHGVEQDQRWDITWIPGRRMARNDVGPWIRRNLARVLDGASLDY